MDSETEGYRGGDNSRILYKQVDRLRPPSRNTRFVYGGGMLFDFLTFHILVTFPEKCSPILLLVYLGLLPLRPNTMII